MKKAGSGGLYPRLTELAAELLQPRLQSLFEAVDDALFARAEKAESNAQQTQYFDGMREVRKKRGRAERAFGEALTRRFEAFDAQRPEPERAAPEAPADRDAMTLVEDRELEEELAITEMIAKGERRLSGPLYALNQRLGALLGIPPPSDADNPFGPAALCKAFRSAAGCFDVETPVLIVVYKLFDKQVVGELAGVYGALNRELIAGDVLPRLRAAPPAGNASPGGPAPRPGADGSPTPAGPPVGGEEAADGAALPSRLLKTIFELLSGRRAAAPALPAESPRLDTTDLLNALQVLQGDFAPASAAGPVAIKAAVLDQAARLTNRDTAAAAAGDEDSIDLVAMLFEFILSDRNLPDAMQVLLSRLQIPYIKVALLDRRLFASRHHPARRLLDALAEACVGWSRESDRGQKLYNKVSEVVEAVLLEFDDDLSTFERLLEDFEQFLTKSRRRAEVTEKRTTEATEGRERLQHARQRAAREIGDRLERQELPGLIEELLRKPWANALVLTHLRHGEDSEEFRDAVKFADDLIWTARPKATAGDVARLQSALPHLAKRLRTGLTMVAYQEEDIAKVFKGLKQLYRSMIDSQYREQLTMPGLVAKPRPAPAPVVTPVALPEVAGASGEDIVAAAADDESPAAPVAVDEARLRWLRDLKPGTWFEFCDEAGNRVRAKLSWKSPITSKFLLVDQKGLKVADKPIEELAQEIVAGDTVVLEAVPLFQRALGAIADRLRDEKGHGGGDEGAGEAPSSTSETG